MTYANNILRDKSENEYFAVIYPRYFLRIVDDTTFLGNVVSGTPGVNATYSISFDIKGSIINSVNGFNGLVDSFASVSALPLSNHQYFYDNVNLILYFRDDGFDSSTDTNVSSYVEFKMYLSTKEQIWFSDPSDDTTEQVLWHGVIESPPTISMDTDLQDFGFIPVGSTSIVCSNDQSFFKDIFHYLQFNQSQIICWHQCGERDIDNIDKLLTAQIDTRIDYSPSQITFPIAGSTFSFDRVYSHGGDGTNDYFDAATFGSGQVLNPNNDGSPIRTVYGRVAGFTPINCDFNSDAPTTSNNRSWVVGYGQGVGYWDSKSATIISGTTTSVTVSRTTGKYFAVNDRVWIDKASDQWATVETIGDNGTNTVINLKDITGTTLGGTLASNTIKKSFVRNVYILDQSAPKWYQLEYGRDYTEATFAQNTSGFTLTSTAESNAGSPTFDPKTHILFCDVAGKQTLPTIGGLDFDTRSSVADGSGFVNSYGAFQFAPIVLYDFIKSEFGLSEGSIDTAAFSDILTNINKTGLGFAIPINSTDQFPSYGDIIKSLLKVFFAKIFFDKDGKLTIKAIKKITAADHQILKEEMFAFKYIYDNSNTTRFNHDNVFQENKVSPTYRAAIGLDDPTEKFIYMQGFDPQNLIFDQESDPYNKITNISDANDSFVPGCSSVFALDGILPNVDLVPTREDIYQWQSRQIQFYAKNILMTANIGESLEVVRDDLPGGATSRFYVITKISKGDGEVQITADEQIGVQGI